MKKRFNSASLFAFTGTAANLLLFMVKLYIANSCNSISIYLDSLNNLLDSAVCLAAGLGFVFASKKSTQNYPFGFGRIEGVVNFLISVIILIAGFAFAYSSLNRLMYPFPVWYSTKYAVTLVSTVPVKLALLAVYKRANRKTHSEIFDSLSLDSVLDSFITLCSFTALVLSSRIGFSVDGVAGMIISIILIVQGIRAVKDSFAVLIGRRDEELCRQIEKAALEAEGVCAVDSVQCHVYGKKVIANISLETNGEKNINEIISEIKNGVKNSESTEIYINIGG